MTKAKLSSILLIFIFTCVAVSCSGPAVRTEEAVSGTVPNLNNVQTHLPEAPGYKTYYSNCLVCHSDRYVLDQPDLPAKSWTAIVTKMQKTFGAPVADSSAEKIIQYLVAIKGIE